MIPNPIFTALKELAECLCAQIEADGLPGLCYCGVMPGEAPSYIGGEECDAGMAWVRLETAYPATVVGQQSIREGNCSSAMGFDFEVGIMRPLPEVVGDGTSDEAVLLAVTEIQIADSMAMYKAISCCMQGRGYILGAYTPRGPEGGILGGTYSVNMMEF